VAKVLLDNVPPAQCRGPLRRRGGGSGDGRHVLGHGISALTGRTHLARHIEVDGEEQLWRGVLTAIGHRMAV
jgi:hypothetical protein